MSDAGSPAQTSARCGHHGQQGQANGRVGEPDELRGARTLLLLARRCRPSGRPCSRRGECSVEWGFSRSASAQRADRAESSQRRGCVTQTAVSRRRGCAAVESEGGPGLAARPTAGVRCAPHTPGEALRAPNDASRSWFARECVCARPVQHRRCVAPLLMARWPADALLKTARQQQAFLPRHEKGRPPTRALVAG